MRLLRDLIDIPEALPPNRFVLRLSQGIQDPEATVGDYVVTDQLVGCFEKALGIVKQALADRSSYGAYLHGSFGSGKSHFMAVLHLILTGHPVARGIRELADPITRHNGWMGGKKFLLVPYHMIGAKSLEEGVLKGYCDFLTRTQPGASLPPIYQSAALIEQARKERARYGDTGFFEGLNAGGGRSGWGAIEADWTPERFEAAARAAAHNDEHTALVTRLSEHYDAAAHLLSDYINIDDGLSVLSRHAKSLGYDGLVLFLDELMLWLAAHATDHQFLQVETAKLAKLVEPQNPDRPVPIVSFIARQRDLRELVGSVPGAERINYGDFVQWNQDRFGMITLEDRNLPVITERRLLKPKSDAARAEIDAAFQRTAGVRAAVRQTLLTADGDDTVFRQVYPFTPALIQTLVAVSSVLQRDRTALKVLSQLLVEHRDSLTVNDLVPIGDLFDVLIHGDAVTDTDVITNFENAEKLYHTKLLPMLERQHDRRLDDIKALPPGDPLRKRFEAHDRLLKTLLLAALVPDVESLRGMTAARLAALNHGTIAAPIAGREVQIVAGLLREWAGAVGEIQLSGKPEDPSVSIQLSDVDTDTIIQQARAQDSYGNRVRMIRQIVFQEALGIDEAGFFEHDHAFEWRGIKRKAGLLFANVREMSHDQLSGGPDDWKLVIDFPFDRDNHSPRDDLTTLGGFRTARGATKTIVWIPAFFSQRTLDDLGRLAILEHVLGGDRFDQYASHLSPASRQAARLILENQRNTLHGQMTAAVNTAYGIETAVAAGVLDPALDLELGERFQSLSPGLTLRPPAQATLSASLDNLLGQALAWEFQAAPLIGTPLTTPKLNTVLKKAIEAAGDPLGRAEVARDDRRLMEQIANPLLIGEMPPDGTHFVLGRHWVEHFLRCQQNAGGDLTVEKLRHWIDEPKKMGLTREAENLIILVYAAQSGMTFTQHGGTYEGTITRLDDAWVLAQETPPDEQDWALAVPRAGSFFGVAVSRLCTAANASVLAGKVKEIATAAAPGARQYAALLRQRLHGLGVGDTADRLATATATQALLDAVVQSDERGVVGILARATVPTTETAIGECVRNAGGWARSLEGEFWALADRVAGLPEDLKARAQPILDDVRQALVNDSHVNPTPLGDVIATASRRLLDVLVPAPGPVPPPPPPPPPRPDPDRVPLPVPATGSESVSPERVVDRIAEIRRAHPAAEIEVAIRWKTGNR
jgi:hypothetical protein